MKLFQVIQKNFTVLGIGSNQSRFNLKLLKTCLTYGLSFTSSAIFLFFEARSFIEFTNNIYVTTAIAVITIYFSIWMWKLQKFFQLIDNLENFFEKSECISNILTDQKNNLFKILNGNIFQNHKIHHRKQSITKLIGQ